MGQIFVEQRKAPRRRCEVPQGLRIWAETQAGEARTVAAILVDTSDSGVGVETYVPLRVGSTVAVEGKLQHSSYSLMLKGQARVVHTKAMRDGGYRIGLAFEEVAYRRSA